MIKHRNIIISIILFSFIIFAFACSHKKVLKQTTSPIPIRKHARVLVLPFQKITKNSERKLTCNVVNKKVVCSYSEEQFKQIGRKLANDFYYLIDEKRKDYHPISIDSVEKVFKKPIDSIPLNEIVARFNLDYIIEGYVYKFIERIGSEYSVKRPATVHFVIGMRDATTGEILWQKEYYEQQQELSKNLLNIFNFFKRKAKWLTALELAEYELNKIVQELP